MNEKDFITCFDFFYANLYSGDCCESCHVRALRDGEIYNNKIDKYVVLGCCNFFREMDKKINIEYCEFVDILKNKNKKFSYICSEKIYEGF